jgi:hypothetical protein
VQLNVSCQAGKAGSCALPLVLLNEKGTKRSSGVPENRRDAIWYVSVPIG